jgi:DNA-binding NarL/FixJ family response regulator
MNKIRILVADDHHVIRRGLIELLKSHEHFEVVGEAADGLEAVTKARALSPDLVIMDIEMPKLSGLSATEVLHQENPRMKILFLSAYPAKAYAPRIFKCGASGYLSKLTGLPELLKTIEKVVAGKELSTSPFAQASESHMIVSKATRGEGVNLLSPREREVVAAIADGLCNKEIAVRLSVEVGTIETYRERIFNKLNIRNTAVLTQFAIAHRLTTLR